MSRPPALPEATVSEFDGVRYLHLDSPWVQGAMRIASPRSIELEYVRRMMAALLWLPPQSLAGAQAVQLGLGAGTITRFCHGVLRMRCTAVELNPGVIRACRTYFRLPHDEPRLAVIEQDAARWVAEPAHRGSARLLHVDLYDHEAAAPVLDDEAFYADCRGVLAEGGVMAVNLFGRQSSFERSAGYIAQAFGRDQVWRVQSTREGNTVVVAARGVAVPDRAGLDARAATLEQRYGLPARKWLRMVRPL